MKDKTTALILSVLLGGLGVDRFYLGYTGMGVLKLLTGGLFGILWLIDIINIATGSLKPADGSEYASNNVTQPVQAVPQKENLYENLKKMSVLHEQGVITDEEFAKIKADYMAKL